MESKFNAMFLTRNPDAGLYEKIPAAVAPESLLAFNEKGCVDRMELGDALLYAGRYLEQFRWDEEGFSDDAKSRDFFTIYGGNHFEPIVFAYSIPVTPALALKGVQYRLRNIRLLTGKDDLHLVAYAAMVYHWEIVPNPEKGEGALRVVNTCTDCISWGSMGDYFTDAEIALIRSSLDPIGVYKFPELEERVAI